MECREVARPGMDMEHDGRTGGPGNRDHERLAMEAAAHGGVDVDDSRPLGREQEATQGHEGAREDGAAPHGRAGAMRHDDPQLIAFDQRRGEQASEGGGHPPTLGRVGTEMHHRRQRRARRWPRMLRVAALTVGSGMAWLSLDDTYAAIRAADTRRA